MELEAIVKTITTFLDGDDELRRFLVDTGNKFLEYKKDVSVLITSNGLIIYANENFCKLFQCNYDEMLNTDAYKLVPPADQEILRKCIEKLYEKGFLEHVQRVVTNNGGYTWVKATSIYSMKHHLTISFFTKIKCPEPSDVPIYDS